VDQVGDAAQRLDTVAAKWPMLALVALRGGPLRFSELQRQIPGVSQKMLTQTVRALESEQLVTRTVYAEVPPRVEYALTRDGAAAAEAAGGLVSWSASPPAPSR
jgi:DNA-binding HxlR family transcriptional regulator